MAELKTKKTTASVKAFLETITPQEKRDDSFELVKIFEEISKEKAAMWGTAIIGFGTYHYKSERSSQEGDWPRAGFSPRKQNLTIYLVPGFQSNKKLLEKLGKYKVSGGSCLYINRLSDINIEILKELIKDSWEEMNKRYPTK